MEIGNNRGNRVCRLVATGKRDLRKWGCTLVLAIICAGNHAHALPIAEIIKAAIVRVIVAVDLQVQRMQNETIALQQAQQKLENLLSKTRLEEIAEWSERQRALYGDYYEGLWKVKSFLSDYQRVRRMAETQRQMVETYWKTWAYLRASDQFSVRELSLMESAFSNILAESIENLGELAAILKPLASQQSDGQRLQRIHLLDNRIQANHRNLSRLCHQLESISRLRADQRGEWKTLEQIYDGR